MNLHSSKPLQSEIFTYDDQDETRRLALAIRADVKRVVSIYHVMFSKLLSERAELPLELAELLEEAGNRYLDMSEQISAAYLSRSDAAMLRG